MKRLLVNAVGGIIAFLGVWYSTGLVLTFRTGAAPVPIGPVPVARLSASGSDHSEDTVFAPYRDEELEFANEFVGWVFPAGVKSNKSALVLLQPERNGTIKSIEDYYVRYSQLNELAGTKDLDFLSPPMESYWMDLVQLPESADEFLSADRSAALTRAAKSAVERLDSGQLKASRLDVVVKSLLQRDLYHTFEIVLRASRTAHDADARDRGTRMLPILAAVVSRLRFADSEIHELQDRVHSMMTRAANESPDAAMLRDRLPLSVFQQDDSALDMHFRLDDHQHFGAYRGRSQFRTYISVPGWTRREMQEYWDETWNSVGPALHLTTVPRELPAGTETTLVRTMSLFAHDWSVFDSGLIEEVLVRRFRWNQPRFDPESSDFRGTLQFQYLLDRDRLLSGATALGLRQIADDEPAYVGIFPRSRDLMSSTSETATQSKWNCINCHSESVYGASTIFSLGHERQESFEVSIGTNPVMNRDSNTRKLRLNTDEFLALRSIIGDGTSRHGPVIPRKAERLDE